MTEFKKDDRVRVTAEYPESKHHGAEGTVIGVFEHSYDVKLDNQPHEYIFFANEIELVDPPVEASWNLDALTLAGVHKRIAKFNYSKGEGDHIERRRVVPEAIVTRKDVTYVIGDDPDREDIRMFRLDRIIGDVWVV